MYRESGNLSDIFAAVNPRNTICGKNGRYFFFRYSDFDIICRRYSGQRADVEFGAWNLEFRIVKWSTRPNYFHTGKSS
jgi:hypothetical protein